MRHLVKKAAEIFGRHIYTSRNFFQCKRKIIGRFHKFQCLLQLQNPFVASVFLIRCVFTETFTEESAEKLIHGAENYKLIPLFFGGCRIKKCPECAVDRIADFRIVRLNGNLMICDLAKKTTAGIRLVHQHIHIEHQTFVYAIIGNTGMDRTGWDENTVSRFCKKFNFINGNSQRST